MPDPTAPAIPADAPQDVKDFFDCKGSTLLWRSGEVTWLGLKVTPSVTFAPGTAPGSVNITVSLLGGMVGFTLPASVNAAGELVVDTTSVPDLSEWGLGGRSDIDAAIKRINDWFKHNGKKLKPARLVGGSVALEKVPIAVVPAAVPVTGPVKPTPPTTPPPPPAPPATGTTPSTGGGWCSLLGILMLVAFAGVIALGAGIGFAFFGQVAPGPATPTPYPTYYPSPTPEPTSTPYPTYFPSPTPEPTPEPTASPTPSPGPSPSPSPEVTVTPSPPPIGHFAAVCIRVVHEQVGEFVSYLDLFVAWTDSNVEYFEITVLGANDDEPQRLEFVSADEAYEGVLGLHQAGDKRIVSVIAHLYDGSQYDLTQDMIDYFGSDEFTVRYPQEDDFGDCPD